MLKLDVYGCNHLKGRAGAAHHLFLGVTSAEETSTSLSTLAALAATAAFSTPCAHQHSPELMRRLLSIGIIICHTRLTVESTTSRLITVGTGQTFDERRDRLTSASG